MIYGKYFDEKYKEQIKFIMNKHLNMHGVFTSFKHNFMFVFFEIKKKRSIVYRASFFAFSKSLTHLTLFLICWHTHIISFTSTQFLFRTHGHQTTLILPKEYDKTY